MESSGVPPTNPAGTRPLRILIVDDDELDRLAVRRCLQQSGIAAAMDEAVSAADALDRVRPSSYDCVLLDYYMPGVDSLSLLRRLQAAAHDIPIVIFTGRGDEEVAVEFMKAGASDYLPKASLTPERLATSLRYAMEMARAADTRRQVEQALREREAEFRTLANAIPQMAWIADMQGRRNWYNDRWYEFTGLLPDESLGLGWRLVQHPEHRDRVCNGQLAAFARGESWEDTFPLKRRDGVYRWFLARAVPIRAAEGRVDRWFGTHTDITERLEAERALAASEERFRRALEIETVGVAFFNLEGEITGANDAFLQMVGYSRDDLAAGLLRRDRLTPPEWMPPTLRSMEEFTTTGRVTPYQKEYIRKDGSRSWALFTATRLSEREGVAFVLDTTEQKKGELEREQLLALEQAARAAAERATRARDEVLAIVAHDLRNPMHTILGAASMLAVTAEEDKRLRHVGIIQRSTREMEHLISDLLDVARIESGTLPMRKERVDVPTLIDEALELFEHEALERKIALGREIADDVQPISADRGRLIQVLSNLLGNALKFTTEGRGVSVRAARLEQAVQISVTDSGTGIPEEDLPHLFDRFWQANRASRAGAGLGLAICKGIVEAHGGRIWAASAVGRGTTIHFTLPYLHA
jgi:PAS domain S-box-containing protein